MDPLEQDQEYFRALLAADSFFTAITVLAETKGETEASILQKLSTLNKKEGKIGAIAVVLQPELVPAETDAPGPEYRVRLTVQVIEDRLTNRTAAGTGKTSWEIAQRVRALGHRRNFGDGTWSFTGLIPAPQQVTTRDSVLIIFTRLGRDTIPAKAATPLIEPEGGATPANVALTAAPGATLLYSTDGDWPDQPYTVPFAITTPCTLRVLALETGKVPSDLATAIFT